MLQTSCQFKQINCFVNCVLGKTDEILVFILVIKIKGTAKVENNYPSLLKYWIFLMHHIIVVSKTQQAHLQLHGLKLCSSSDNFAHKYVICVCVFSGFSVDWWALGVLMFEMMAGRSPFDIVGSSDNPDQNTEDYLFQGDAHTHCRSVFKTHRHTLMEACPNHFDTILVPCCTRWMLTVTE